MLVLGPQAFIITVFGDSRKSVCSLWWASVVFGAGSGSQDVFKRLDVALSIPGVNLVPGSVVSNGKAAPAFGMTLTLKRAAAF